MACGVWSLFQDVVKTYGEHSSPAICEAPALVIKVKVLLSTIGLSEASATFDQM
jgi:hypothetical protein